MTSNDSSTPVRSLPTGYDDESLPFFVPADLRGEYLAVHVAPDELDAALDRRRGIEDHAQALALWREERDQTRAVRSPEFFQNWLKRQRVDSNGIPPLWVLTEVLRQHTSNDRRGRTPDNVRQLTEQQIAEVTHQVALHNVQRNRDRADQTARRRAAQQRADTCTICGVISSSTKSVSGAALRGRPRGGTAPEVREVRACSACTTVAPLVALLAAETPTSGSRLGAVASWLDQGGGTSRALSEAEIDAWLDDPKAEMPGTIADEQRPDESLFSRLTRTFSSR